MRKLADATDMCTAAKSRGHGPRSRVAVIFVIAAARLAAWCGARFGIRSDPGQQRRNDRWDRQGSGKVRAKAASRGKQEPGGLRRAHRG